MCGISGIVSQQDKNLFNDIRLMNNSLRHRGPDDEGYVFFKPGEPIFYSLGGDDTPDDVYASKKFPYTPIQKINDRIVTHSKIVLAHRRLSIIDLSPAAHQPMCSDDKRYWIVFNGEIYNYLELRDELKKFGYDFHSQSDTEVLLKGYIHWSENILNRLIGMFSFAIFDHQKGELFLARDFFGIKPLYYLKWPQGFAFASEIKALLCIPFAKRNMNLERVFNYLCTGLTDFGSETMFADIRQLPAAHYLRFQIDELEFREPIRYWDIEKNKNTEISYGEASKRLRDIFLENVDFHLRSDVGVGAALSGGIDSSAIVMSMRLLKGESLNLHTFSYIDDNPKICEEKWVEIVGNASNAFVHKVQANPKEMIDDLGDLVYYQGEPFGSTSIYAQYRVMRLAKENNIKVMLDGQGADEVAAGYSGYYGALLANFVRQLKWLKALIFYINTVRYGYNQWLNFLVQTGQYFVPIHWRSSIMQKLKIDRVHTWLRDEWFRDSGINLINTATDKKNCLMKERMYQSLTHGGLNSLLRYEDRNSMAFSIESRVPFLTPKLADYLFSLPDEYLIDVRGRSKSVFRSAMQGIVPDSILERTDKIGFATSEQEWLSTMRLWIEQTFKSEAAKELLFINMDEVYNDWIAILSGKVKFDWRIWRIINLIKWMEQSDARLN